MGGKNAVIVDSRRGPGRSRERRRRFRLRVRRGQKCSAGSAGHRGHEAACTISSYIASWKRRKVADRWLRPESMPVRQRRPGNRRREPSPASTSFIESGQASSPARLRLPASARSESRWRRILRRSDGLRRCPRERPTIAQEEIFGPVLSVIKAKDLDDALAHCQRHQVRPHRWRLQPQPGEHRPTVKRRFRVGNLYVNRKCTGALVHRQPVRRLQAERHRVEGRRAGLPVAVRAAANRHREHPAARLRSRIAGRRGVKKATGGVNAERRGGHVSGTTAVPAGAKRVPADPVPLSSRRPNRIAGPAVARLRWKPGHTRPVLQVRRTRR